MPHYLKSIFFWVGLLHLSPIHAQDDRKTLEAYKLGADEIIMLDGYVNEAFWENVQVAEGFLQQEPVEGKDATEATEVRVAYDDEYLYISVILYDSDPSGIKAFQKRWDQPLFTDDRFMMILDPFNDQRSAYYFEINPLGLMGDALIRVGQGTNFNKAWDGIWRAWVKQGDYGWSAEIRIPFMTLNFDPNADGWGINFQRTVRRKNEETLWTGHKRNQGILRPQDAGLLTGLQNLSQGLGIEVNPYAIMTQSNIRLGDGTIQRTFTPNAGGDINYSISPTLRAGITVNTDFAETEVDDRQINLTRFPLFFPERRRFFLEGSSVFLFAPASGVNPYFSRRIGLEDGRPIPIQYGARMMGRVNRTDVGLLHVKTGEGEGLPDENFTVARVLQNVFKESTIGAIYTRRATAGDSLPVRHTYGTDLEWNTSDFLGKYNLQYQAFFIGTTPGTFEDSTSIWDRSSRGMRINFPNQPWSGHMSYREFGTHYDPVVGFAPRVGFRRLQPSIAYSPLIENSDFLREVTFSYYFEYLMDMNFRPATVNHRIGLIGIRLESGDELLGEFTHNFEYLDFDFDILRDDRFIIPIGEYQNPGLRWAINTAPFRKLSASFTHVHTGFWTGTRTSYFLFLFLRPGPGMNFSWEWEHSNVKLTEGDFQTNLFRLISGYDFSPWVSLNFNIQYDNVTNALGTNTRFQWMLKPGNLFFIVYNHNWFRPEERFVSLQNVTNVKLTYTWRF